ncbi:hypothetical protein WDZ92_38755, partial [Nostoc sp. NIES-2111]
GAVAIEVMLAQPERFEAKRLAQIHFAQHFLEDLAVPIRHAAFGEEEIAEAHGNLHRSDPDRHDVQHPERAIEANGAG